MKNGVRNLILMLLDKNIDMCCLCLNVVKDNKINLEDEIPVSEKCSVIMRVLLSYVFGETTIDRLAGLGTICNECAVFAVNSYKFIKKSKNSVDNLSQVIEHLETLFDTSSQDVDDCKTLFLSIDLKPKLSSCQMYDNVDVNSNVNNAFQRYRKLKSNQTELDGKKEKPEEFQRTIINKISVPTTKVENVKVESIKPLKINYSVLQGQEARLYNCPECPQTFSTAILLRSHKKNIHTKLICMECGRQFNHPHTLKMHEQGHYMKYVCQECGRVYKNQTTLRLHYENNVCKSTTRNSPANAKFTCDYCNKKYTQKMTLRVHIQHEHLNYKSHECKWCKKKFWCQSRLKAHIVKHTKERNYLCETCNKKFVTKESLLYHTRIHTGEKPYECPHCDGRFLSASRRKAHITSQHENPSIECDKCHSKFKSHHYLLKHLKSCSSHTGLPQPFKNQNLPPLDYMFKIDESQSDEYKLFKMPPKKLFESIKYSFDHNDERLKPLHNVQVKKPKMESFVKNEIIQVSIKNEMQYMHKVNKSSQSEMLPNLSKGGENYGIVSEYVVV